MFPVRYELNIHIFLRTVDLKGRERDRAWSHLRQYPGICLSQNSWSPSRDMKPTPPELLTILP
jgi:hypothetical protein